MTTLNKQALINLLIDSPLREAIKINLIDIINNTNDADLEKTYSTISKELEIYQKATERRLKLAGETIAQLSGTAAPTETTDTVSPVTEPSVLPPLPPLPPMPPMPAPTETADTVSPVTEPSVLPPLPPLPPMPPMPQAPVEVPKEVPTTSAAPLTVPPLDLPPMPSAAPTVPTSPAAADSDEAALQEIQKELDALKNSATVDAQ